MRIPLTLPAIDRRSLTRTRRGAHRRISLTALLVCVSAAITSWAAAPGPTTARPAAPVPAANTAAAADHFQKAKDLYEAKKYPEALQEIDQSLKLDPNSGDAQVLRRVLVARISDTGTGPATGPASAATQPKFLTAQQMSIVRLMESSDGEPIRGSVPRKTLDEFWQSVWSKTPNADLSTTAYNNFLMPGNFPLQAQRIKESANQKFIEQVNVTSDPAVLIQFGNIVSPFVLQNCATAECHSGSKGGNFRLLTGGPAALELRYTNFYLLSTYTSAAGQMLDRNNPDNSLLLQYALPKATAKSPHPKVETRTRINAVNDPQYQRISNWIRSLNLPAPNYGFTFAGAAPATTPAAISTAPATGSRPR